MLDNFKTWIELVDAGPILPTQSSDRRVDLKSGGLVDKTVPKPMRPEPITSAFPTYGGPPLPKIGRKPVIKTV